MVEQKPSKLTTRVRFPSPAPRIGGCRREKVDAVTASIRLSVGSSGTEQGRVQPGITAKDEILRPCSSVVEHSLGKGEVERSIRSMGTKGSVVTEGIFRSFFRFELSALLAIRR